MGKGNRRRSNKMLRRKAQARFKARAARRKAGEKPVFAGKKKSAQPVETAEPAAEEGAAQS